MIRWFVLLLGLSFTFSTQAKLVTAEDCTKEPEVVAQARELASVAEVPGGCAKAEKLRGICDDVYKNFSIDDHDYYLYTYEKKIHEAACADPIKDSPDLVNRKIQSMWLKLEDKLDCDAANFDVPNGNILKYSVKLQNFEFLTSAAEVWKVNLNKIDSSDNRTLLDYVKFEIERTKGLNVHSVLKDYYKILREKGAKHRSEL